MPMVKFGFFIKAGNKKEQFSMSSTQLTKILFSLQNFETKLFIVLSFVAQITKKESLISSISTFLFL